MKKLGDQIVTPESISVGYSDIIGSAQNRPSLGTVSPEVLAAIEKHKNDVQVNPDDQPGRVKAGLKNVIGGAASAVGSTVRGATELATAAGIVDQPEDVPFFYGAGKGLEMIGEKLSVTDNPYREEFSQQVASGVGQAIGYMAGGFAGTAARLPAFAGASIMGAAGTAAQGADDYRKAIKESGKSFEQEDYAKSVFLNALVGTSEGIPLGNVLNRFDRLSGGSLKKLMSVPAAKRIALEGAKGGFEESVQEMFSNVASDLIARDLVAYDPDRELFVDTAKSGEVGGAVGILLNTVGAAFGIRSAGRIERALQKARDKAQVQGTPVDDITAPSAPENAPASEVAPDTGKDFETPEVAKAFARGKDILASENVTFEQSKAEIQNISEALKAKFIDVEKPDATKRSEANSVITELNNLVSRNAPTIESTPLPDGAIVRDTGDPYKGPGAAASQLKKKGLVDTHEVVKLGDKKYVIVPKPEVPIIEQQDTVTTAEEIAKVEQQDIEAQKTVEDNTTKVNENVPADFAPTHVLSDGELVKATPEPTVFKDVDGNEVEDTSSEPLSTTLVQEYELRKAQEALTDELPPKADTSITVTEQAPTEAPVASEDTLKSTAPDIVSPVLETSTEAPIVQEAPTETLTPQETADLEKVSPTQAKAMLDSGTELPGAVVSALQEKAKGAIPADSIVRADGKPFTGKGPANAQLKKKGLTKTHEVIELAPKQFAIVPKASVSEETAATSTKAPTAPQTLQEDPLAPQAYDEDLAQSVEQIRLQIQTVGDQVDTLQEELDSGFAEDEGAIKREILSKKREIIQLRKDMEAATKSNKKASKAAKFFEEEALAASKIDMSDVSPEDMDYSSTNAKSPSFVHTEEGYVKLQDAFDLFRSRVKIPKGQEVRFVMFKSAEDMANTPGWEGVRAGMQTQFDSVNVTPKALHISHINGSTSIIVFADKQPSPAGVVMSLLHETIGHYGMRHVFGENWEGFLRKSLSNTKGLMQTAYDRVAASYKHLDLTPIEGKRTINVLLNGKMQKVDEANAMMMLEEYIARTSETMLSKENIEALSGERGFIKRLAAWVRHKLRSFGIGTRYREYELTQDDINGLLANVHGKLIVGSPFARGVHRLSTETINKSADRVGDKYYVDETGEVIPRARRGGPGVFAIVDGMENMQAAIEEGQQAAIDQGASKDQVESLASLQNRNYGKVGQTAYQVRINKVLRSLKESNIARPFRSLGNLSAETIYSTQIEGQARGKLTNYEQLTRRLKKSFRKMPPVQRQAVYSYFKTKDASLTDLSGFSAKVRDDLVTAKSLLEDFGKQFYERGMLPEEVYEANRGTYLPTRYMAYLKGSTGGGKKTSFFNYLKSQKEMTTEEKAYLGQIVDPEFVIIESINVIGRDLALLDMYDSIKQVSNERGLGWILDADISVSYNGKSMTLEGMREEIERVEKILSDGVGGQLYNHDAETVTGLQKTLEDIKASYDLQQAALIERVKEMMKANAYVGEATDEAANAFIDQSYSKLPRDRRLGSLSGALVRKEIYNDLMDGFEVEGKGAQDFFTKLFAPGGGLETANQAWKAIKVPLNVPSYPRNFGGNAGLLDISSPTNSITLNKMIFEEGKGLVKGENSWFAEQAMNMGLFGNTFSVQELYLLQRQFSDVAKRRLEKAEYREKMASKTAPFKEKLLSPLKQFWWATDEKMAILLEETSHVYGFMEGLFKTVKLRDHLEIWAVENGGKRSDARRMFQALTPNEQKALLVEAADGASKAIFDYSKVPSFIRTLRKYPLGSPFITFMYKALPVTLESMIRRPQKFVKYMALPYVLTQAMMMANDFDDEDVDEIVRKMPRWMQDKGSVYLLPTKDANGKWVPIDVGYFFPWAPFQDLFLKIKNNADLSSPSDAAYTAASSMKDIVDTWGIAGGVVPTMISALATNKDDFTGKEIITTGAPAGQRMLELSAYMWTLWTPSWMGDKGALVHMWDATGLGEPLNRFGTPKETGLEASGRMFGINTYPFDPQESHINNIKSFKFEESRVLKARRSALQDRNLISPEDRARVMREYSELLKRVRERRKEYMQGDR